MSEPYSAEVLAALRPRYEDDLHDPVAAIADEFGMNERTVYRLAHRHGWRMRSQPRELPQHLRLAAAARDIALARDPLELNHLPLVPTKAGTQEPQGNEPFALDSRFRGNERKEEPPSHILAIAATSGEAPGGNERSEELSALDRLERLVLKEIEIEEAERAALGNKPRSPADAAHKARAYASLLQTLQKIDYMRKGEPLPYGNSDDIADDMPRDLDEFRRELARRIEAFVASRADGGDAAEGGEPGMVDAPR